METDFNLALSARARNLTARWCALLLLMAVACPGCALVGSRSHWYSPAAYEPDAAAFASCPDSLTAAEAQYEAARQADEAGDPGCIDRYFAAATLAWPCYASAPASDEPAAELYRSSVNLFIQAAARFGRFNRAQGVVLSSGQTVPVAYCGFVWQPADFCKFLPVGCYETPRLTNRYVSAGMGVPYVVLSTNPPRHPFTNFCQPFAATAVLSPSRAAGGQFTLQFYDPLRTTATEAGAPLARDLTAPIAYAVSQETDDWLLDFFRPGSHEARDGLHMREPFQPGKIPVVFIHGLASDPLTWSQMENDLRAMPAIFNRFQFWYFRYDTGGPFLGSAARLRMQLAAIRQTYDPMRCNPNMSQMVLIGHSMGGLLAQLQVTYSGNCIWQAAATQPFNTIITDPVTRADLTAAFFFQPSPDVNRVVYIATPHRGSSQATRMAGRLSSSLIEVRPVWDARHEQLVRDNPCAFREEIQEKIPTSVDLLEPGSLILQSTQQLPYRQGVALNSIVGDYRWASSLQPSDSVVAVSSAQLGGGETQAVVDARHTGILQNEDTIREVSCILMRHAAAFR
jgi:pimeloyl-ACP methyl ester carboxylesterase